MYICMQACMQLTTDESNASQEGRMQEQEFGDSAPVVVVVEEEKGQSV